MCGMYDVYEWGVNKMAENHNTKVSCVRCFFRNSEDYVVTRLPLRDSSLTFEYHLIVMATQVSYFTISTSAMISKSR
jgi:hypothetical protein